MQLADRLSRIEASKTLQVKEKALELKARGVDVVDLTAGEPDFKTPDFIAEEAIKAIRDGFTHYTANAGIPRLREAIANKLSRDNGLRYQPEQIIVSNGAKQSIMNALFAILNEGDEVLVPAPYWVSYPEQVKMAGGIPVMIPGRHDTFKISAAEVEKHISPRTRAIILNSPCNPTGAVYTADELERLARIFRQRDIWIISDEIYEKLLYDGMEHNSIAAIGDLIEKSIVVNGFSKAYAMTGWRIGYAAAPLDAVKGMSKIQSHYTSNASSISQKAALAALEGPQEEVEKMRRIFEERRNLIRDYLNARPYFDYVLPHGAFYYFIKISRVFGHQSADVVIDDSIKFATYLAEKHHLVVVPGAAFGSDEHIRISFAASSEELEKGMTRLTAAMDALLEK